MKYTKDSLGDRMKQYEYVETSRLLIPRLPTIVRIDGKNFHTYTKGFCKPFDVRIRTAMTETTKRLVEETNAVIGYTQSDEITLILPDDRPVLFEGRIFKLVSYLASFATMVFNQTMEFEDKKYATFDCRIFQVPSREEACNHLIWRELDAVRNSVQALAHKHFSHKQLQNLNTDQLKNLLSGKGIDWNTTCSPYCKRGVYIKRRIIERKFTKEELKKLPPKHQAKTNPELIVTRSELNEIYFPYYLKDIENRMGVIYLNELPIVRGDVVEIDKGEDE